MATPVDTHYSIDREQIIWQGLDLLSGIAQAENNVVEKLDDVAGWKQKSNGVGGVTQIHNPSTSGELTITVQMETPLHLALKRLAIADMATRLIVGTITRTRPSGEKILYQSARIKRPPDESVGMETGDVEWVWIFARRVQIPPGTQANIVVGS